MARERMVTRTIKSTLCEVMAVKVETAEVITDYLTLTGDTYTPDKAIKELKSSTKQTLTRL